MSIPQSTINVCSNVRLNSRYEHSIYFADRTAQLNYFAGKVVKTFSAYSFIRKSWDLNVAATMEEAASWSYLYFTNSANGKRYFYFIDNIEYVNDGTVRLKLQIDVLQTYLFDFALLPSFVERQHTETDAVGDHTIDEGLDTGELIESNAQNWGDLSEMCILVLSTINPNYSDTEEPVDAFGFNYDYVFSGLSVWAIESKDWATWSTKLQNLSKAGFIDGIVAMWMYPKACVDLGGENEWGDDVLCKVVQSARYAGDSHIYNVRDNKLDGHTPKNNKLLTFPYRFLYATNNQGGSAVYRFERFGDPSVIKFRAIGGISPDSTIKMYPENYNGVGTVYKGSGDPTSSTSYLSITGNYDHGLSIGNFPSCAWDADVYKLWLAQNQNQIQHNLATAGLGAAGGVITAIASAAMGNVAGAVGGVAATVASAQQIGTIMAQKADMAIQPPQSRGVFSSNVNIATQMQTFTFYTKSVDTEHAKAIDDYFTMYGYKINRVQKPNIHARKSHTYVKTIGCHIDADLCNEDATKIEAIFDRGVTFWTNGDRIGQYTDDNSTL